MRRRILDLKWKIRSGTGVYFQFIDSKLYNFLLNNRKLETVDRLLDAARLDKDDFYPNVQTIYLGSNITNDDLKLLEVDEENLNFLLEGNR